jgi:hypothetical protein
MTGTEQRVCPRCSARFLLRGEQIDWFVSKGLTVPTKCPACRAEKRRQKAAGGWWPQNGEKS